MNGDTHRFQVFVARYIEEIVIVEAETEHEAVVSIQGAKDKITYIRQLEDAEDAAQPSS